VRNGATTDARHLETSTALMLQPATTILSSEFAGTVHVCVQRLGPTTRYVQKLHWDLSEIGFQTALFYRQHQQHVGHAPSNVIFSGESERD